MNDSIFNRTDYDARSVRDNLVLVAWIFAWMGALTIADKAKLYGWWQDGWMTWLAIAVHVLLGLGVLWKFMRMLKGMDDLQRRIQLESLAIAFGVTLIAAAAYSLLVTWGYIRDEEVSDIFMVMCVTYSAAVLVGSWRYR